MQKKTKTLHPPMTISMIAYEDAQSLDITGPLEVFAMANRFVSGKKSIKSDSYNIEILARKKGPVRMSSGISLLANRSYFSDLKKIDTLIVPGGDGLCELLKDKKILEKIKVLSKSIRRLASVCTGSFLLAEAGLLNGKKATTHWVASDHFARKYPSVLVEPDKIFIQDQNIYTSAGVTAGIDLALALVEDDYGRQTALKVAKALVVFMKRQGGQAQFSRHLFSQIKSNGVLKGLPEWIIDNPCKDLSIEKLARKVAMSERNFSRVFIKEINLSPAKFVENVRIDYATMYLENENMTIEMVAEKSGFVTSEKMRRAFLRNLNVLPSCYRKRFGIAKNHK